jgi:nicotinamide mononucleotide adenylyltransferase
MLSVVIGRFQTPYLTQGHLKLFEEARKNSHRILVLLGMSAAMGTDKNPLSYEMRKAMIDEKLPDDYLLHFAPLHDCPSDKDWSDQSRIESHELVTVFKNGEVLC